MYCFITAWHSGAFYAHIPFSCCWLRWLMGWHTQISLLAFLNFGFDADKINCFEQLTVVPPCGVLYVKQIRFHVQQNKYVCSLNIMSWKLMEHWSMRTRNESYQTLLFTHSRLDPVQRAQITRSLPEKLSEKFCWRENKGVWRLRLPWSDLRSVYLFIRLNDSLGSWLKIERRKQTKFDSVKTADSG